MDKFTDIPDTIQGIGLYISYAEREIKRCERKVNKLKDCINEARRRKDGGLPTNEAS